MTRIVPDEATTPSGRAAHHAPTDLYVSLRLVCSTGMMMTSSRMSRIPTIQHIFLRYERWYLFAERSSSTALDV